jgi:serine/threonine protein kinase
MIPSRPSPTFQRPDRFSPAFNAFIARCLTKDAQQRPSAVDLQKVSVEIEVKESIHLSRGMAMARD